MSDAILRADRLTRHYEVSRGLFKDSATVRALDGVSFELHPGRTLAVVGESGCGKSTLARQLTLIESPTDGALWLAGRNVADASRADRRQARRDVQIIFQNPYGSLNPRKKIGAILQEPLKINTRLSRRQRRDKIQELMATVGLRPEFYDRYPHMFSGGQRQRVAIARALTLDPKIIVADEPVSALDVSIQAQVLNLLMNLQEQTNVAYVFISHDLSVVRHISDDVMVMYLGKAVEHGPKERIFERPRHPYSLALLASMPRLNVSERQAHVQLKGELPSPLNPPPGCSFHTRCPFATDECKSIVPELREVDGRRVACHHAERVGREAAELQIGQPV